jgi:serine/threonine protein kinase
MLDIKVHKSLASVPQWNNNIKEIYLENSPIGSGGFGEIYPVLSVQGQPVLDTVCKIFYPSPLSYKNFMSVQTLQTYCHQYKNILDISVIETLPLLSFEGFLSGKPVYGYLMRHLTEREYANFSIFLEDNQVIQTYYDLAFEHKLHYAKNFVSQIYTLQQLQFIHADISADNLFIHLQQPKVALIDFDSGVIAKDNAKPTTWGKPNDWVEPQIMFDLAQQRTKKLPVVSVSVYSDIWSTHIGVHYLLFMAHPFFFIHTLSEKNMYLYFKHYTWPNAYQGRCDDIFIPSAKEKHEKYLQILHNIVPQTILSCFKQTFNQGVFNAQKRTPLSEWVKIMQGYTTPQNNFVLPSPVTVKKTNYPALKTPKLRPTYKKKATFQPQRKSFYPKYHQKSTFLQLSNISSLKNLPHTGNSITTTQVIKLILVNLGIIILVFGIIHLWESMHRNKWIEKFKNIQPVVYDTASIQNKNPVLRKEYEQYTQYEKSADSLRQCIANIKHLSIQETEKLYEKSSRTLTAIQNRDDSLFKIILRYNGQPDSLYVAYQKWLRSYNTLVQYQKGVDTLKKIIAK